MKKMNAKKFSKTYDCINELKKQKSNRTDVDGSYTGRPKDLELPIQDVDDL